MRAEQGEDPNILAVCISGYTLEPVVHEAESIDNIIFLAMPFSLKQLAGTVRIAIDISLKNAE